MEKEFVVVNKKNVGLRIVLFLIAFGIAVGCFAYGCSTMNKKEPGFYTLDGKNGNEEYFINNTYCHYYLDGVSDSITAKLKTLNILFKDSLIEAYQVVDPTYQEDYIYTGIGKINNSLGEDVVVSEETYRVLQDAYTKTLENKNYNMFAGILYDYWDQLFMNGNYETYDPSINTSTLDTINEIVSYTNNLSNYNLQFKADYVINFNISDSLKAYLNENPILSTNIINLNVLEDAYRLDIIAKRFKEKNYIEGYIYTDSGYEITLYNNVDFEYNQIDYKDNDVLNLGSIKIKDSISFVEFNRFKTYDAEEFDRYYIINNIKRNPYIDLSTGLQNQLLNRFVVFSDNLVDAAYINNQVNAIKTKEELDTFLLTLNSKYHYVYTLNDSQNNLYMDDYLKDKFTANVNSYYMVK